MQKRIEHFKGMFFKYYCTVTEGLDYHSEGKGEIKSKQSIAERCQKSTLHEIINHRQIYYRTSDSNPMLEPQPFLDLFMGRLFKSSAD